MSALNSEGSIGSAEESATAETSAETSKMRPSSAKRHKHAFSSAGSVTVGGSLSRLSRCCSSKEPAFDEHPHPLSFPLITQLNTACTGEPDAMHDDSSLLPATDESLLPAHGVGAATGVHVFGAASGVFGGARAAVHRSPTNGGATNGFTNGEITTVPQLPSIAPSSVVENKYAQLRHSISLLPSKLLPSKHLFNRMF